MSGEPTDRPRPSSSIALLTMARIVERRLEPELAARGMTLRKYGILGHIGSSEGISFSEIARRSGISVQSAHALVQGLATEGLVDATGSTPGSPASLRTTPAGDQLLADLAARLATIDAELFSTPPLSELDAAIQRAIAVALPR